MTTLTNRRIINTMTDDNLIAKGLFCARELEPYAPTAALIIKQLALRFADLLKRRAAHE